MRPEQLTIADLLANTRRALQENGIPDPALEARSLVRAALDISHTELLTKADRSVEPGAAHRLEKFVSRRIRREPLQYITGRVGFYGREFQVDKHVLIPRPETELLIEQSLLRLKECRVERPKILDIGTGSGILAITMAAELPAAHVVATDISSDALDVAKANAELTDVADRIEFSVGSMTAGNTGPFDFVLSNPPYVLTGYLDGPDVQPELKHEPGLALDGGSEGMDVYNQLIPELLGVMASGGAAYIEIDPPVAERCVTAAKSFMPAASVSVLTDLTGLERCMAIELPCQ